MRDADTMAVQFNLHELHLISCFSLGMGSFRIITGIPGCYRLVDILQRGYTEPSVRATVWIWCAFTQTHVEILFPVVLVLGGVMDNLNCQLD